MKSFIVPLFAFAGIVGLILFAGATANGDTQQVVQYAEPVVRETFNWLPCIGMLALLGFGFLGFIIRGGGSSVSVSTTDVIQAVVLNEDPYYNEEVERDTFTNEEILLPGIDIRNPRHREYIKNLRRERVATGISTQQQLNRAKHEERVRPDARSTGGYSREKFSRDDYVSMLNKIFHRADIHFKANMWGGYDLTFNMNKKASLEMTSEGNRTYRIVKVYWKEGRAHRSSKHVYRGSPEGAIQIIKSWYEGGNEWSAWEA